MDFVSLSIGGFVVLVVLYTVFGYNRIVALDRRCTQAEEDIDVQLRQRLDLIPNLVETVKGYAGHERSTLEAVMKARASAIANPGAAGAEAALGGALSRLLAVAEAYPDLKASANFAQLQAEIGDTENKIAAARRFLNAAVNEYNTTLATFPLNVVGSALGFVARASRVASGEARVSLDTAPAVRF